MKATKAGQLDGNSAPPSPMRARSRVVAQLRLPRVLRTLAIAGAVLAAFALEPGVSPEGRLLAQDAANAPRALDPAAIETRNDARLATGDEAGGLNRLLDATSALGPPSPSGEASGGLSPRNLVEETLSPQGLSSGLQVMLLLTVLSLAPALLMMTTSFVRVVVVLSLLRQALGTQQIPPSQVITSIALFLTFLIMTPVWSEVYSTAIAPYGSGELVSLEEAWSRGQAPIRRFMGLQIERTGNVADVWLFLDYIEAHDRAEGEPSVYTHLYGADPAAGEADVPLQALLPAFMLSELKTAFLIGFQIFLPFLVLDLVVAAVLTSMGMHMVQPALISLPFKLLLFVLVDGWRLVVEMLLLSFEPYF